MTYLDSIENKLEFFVKRPFFALLTIGMIGLLVRLYYFPQNVPLVLDGLEYFFYATDVSILGHLPTYNYLANNGWPIFLSIFFSLFKFDNFLDYMNLQRIISISISTLTILPVYYLCKRFFDIRYSIIGSSIFVIEPRLIQNSLLGITDPLYIFLVACSLALFFSKNSLTIYCSFVIIAVASMIRSEGLFVLFPLLVTYYLRNRKEKKVFIKCVIAIAIFVMVLMPMAILRIENYGQDALTGRISSETQSVLILSSHEKGLFSYLIHATENFVKFSLWSLIPTFIFFIPIGIFLILKYRNLENLSIVLIIISMLIPIFYAYSVAPDTRYIYPLFPIFCILSIVTIQRFIKSHQYRNVLLIFIIGIVLLSSLVFLDVKRYDYEHQREAFTLAQKVSGVASGINNYFPEDSYVPVASIPQKWPVLKSSIIVHPSIIQADSFTSLEKYIESARKNNLTHLVLDGQKNRPNFLNDAFYHESKYPYLIKIYESSEHGFKYHLKIFKIDYEKFNAVVTQ